MKVADYAPDEVVRIAKGIYERDIRAKVEANNKGKFLAIDILSGDYEMDADEIAAAHRLRAKHPDAVMFELRVGYRAAHKIGSSWKDLEL